MKLSKTNYIIYRDCGKNAWVKIHKPEVYNAGELSQFEQNIIETGNEIDVLARELFPGGLLVESRDDIELTQSLISAKTPTIYQPVFETDKYKTASDVIVWNEEAQSYDLYEVKASNSGEDKKKKDEIYTHDLAFQSIVLADLNIPINKLYLVRLNNEYVRGVDLELPQLFSVEDFTEKVNAVRDIVREDMKNAYEILSSDQEPQGSCKCIVRGNSAHCTTFKYSNPQVPDYSVHHISRIGVSKKKLEELIDSGIFSIYDVPPEFELSDIQRNQVNAAQSGKETLDHEGLGSFLSGISYPISFIDYETYPSAIPRFVGYSPFNQIPFQFSLHVFEDGLEEPTHTEFLFTESTNPDLPFLEAMQKTLPANGSIIVWNKRFETGVNSQLGERNPEYKEFIEAVNARVIDLEDPFKDQFMVHPGFKGKTSIKSVLPTLAPSFSYKELDIQEGGTASGTWNKMVTNQYTDEEKIMKAAHLRAYCKLDTYAMYLIWKYLKTATN